MHRRSPLLSIVALATAMLLLCACEPLPMPEATPTPEPDSLSLSPPSGVETRPASEIFAEISPAVAFVETEAGTGSGVLVEHNYLLTNAHVVWPFETVRVVFPDGTEYLDVPVFTWDLTADLALVGPLNFEDEATEIEPAPLVDGGVLEIGEDVYLIGYPAEVDEFPQPSITNGILSRVRQWEAIDLSFYQVDATTTGGQSGGILVTHGGDVIGISTFYYSGFGLASSVADALPRLNAMLGNESDLLLSNRPFAQGKGETEIVRILDGYEDSHRYVMREPVDTEVEMEIEGIGRPQITVQALQGYTVAETDELDPEKQDASVSFTVEKEVPYIIRISHLSDNKNEYVLSSSHPLVAYDDPDDGQVLAIGDNVVGALDMSGDFDFFELELEAGDVVEITADALNIDPFISLGYETSTLHQRVYDDDSGSGIFGENAMVVYEAPEDGTYDLTIGSYSFRNNVGSYFLSVAEAPDEAELTELDVDDTFVASGFGPLLWYESEENNFNFLHPANWQSIPPMQCAPGAALCRSNDEVLLILVEEPLALLPKRDRDREGYIRTLSDAISLDPNITVTSSDPITTLQGLPADLVTFETAVGGVEGVRFTYVDEEEQIAFNATFAGQSEAVQRSASMITGLIESFRLWDSEEREDSAVFHLDEGRRLASADDDEGAIEAYTRSIELDPELILAYRGRAWLYQLADRPAEALADLDTVLALDDEDYRYYAGRASLHWQQGAHADALADITSAIELNPEQLEMYNQRALIHAFVGDFDAALADVDKTIELNEGELRSNVQDSRGFIYIKMGDFESALADYNAVFDKDQRYPHALLGAGVTHAKLGDAEQARSLIDEAMEMLDEADVDDPDPQLAELIEMAESVMAE